MIYKIEKLNGVRHSHFLSYSTAEPSLQDILLITKILVAKSQTLTEGLNISLDFALNKHQSHYEINASHGKQHDAGYHNENLNQVFQ